MIEIPSKEDIVELAKQLATPIDFEELEKQGFIKKQGAWFKVRNMNELPAYVLKQATSCKTDKFGNCLVQFPKTWKRAQKMYREMTGKEYNE